MSNILDINELRKRFAENASLEEWKEFATVQNKVIEQNAKHVEHLKNQIKHLENLLLTRNQSSLITELSPEEKICIEQIDRLERQSSERQLTLEEVKRLDLLVKNLKLIREESTIVVNNKRNENVKEADLVAIAQSEPDNS